VLINNHKPVSVTGLSWLLFTWSMSVATSG